MSKEISSTEIQDDRYEAKRGTLYQKETKHVMYLTEEECYERLAQIKEQLKLAVENYEFYYHDLLREEIRDIKKRLEQIKNERVYQI